MVVVESNVEKVQHPTGGIVGELRVGDDQRVNEGDVLLRLDETQTRANLAVFTKGLDELNARQARLEAEKDGVETIQFPEDLLAREATDPEVAHVLAGERKLFSLILNLPMARKRSSASASRSSRSRSAASLSRSMKRNDMAVFVLCALSRNFPNSISARKIP